MQAGASEFKAEIWASADGLVFMQQTAPNSDAMAASDKAKVTESAHCRFEVAARGISIYSKHHAAHIALASNDHSAGYSSGWLFPRSMVSFFDIE